MRRTRKLRMLVLGATLVLSACSTPPPSPTPAQTPALPVEGVTPTATAEARPPAGAEHEFQTDFSQHTVPYTEILSGGPRKDGIPSLDAPTFVDVAAADAWLADVSPVIVLRVGDRARAYPLQILMWHEIVNDTLGDTPVAVTYCPLCNTAIAFARTFDGRVLDFGTTGRLRYSNLIMYDRQTETWWQQATGNAIAGTYAGARLRRLPALLVGWADFKATYPQGMVLSQETGYARTYGQNAYVRYDAPDRTPFLYEGPATPPVLPPMARVLGIERGGEAVAYPYAELRDTRAVNAEVGGEPIVVLWQPGVASALDSARISEGRDVGAAVAFSPVIDGERRTFRVETGRIVDAETGSTWNILGHAVEGPLAGRRLEPAVGYNYLWFAWAAFWPETQIYGP